MFRRGTRQVENRAATALRMAASSLWRSKTFPQTSQGEDSGGPPMALSCGKITKFLRRRTDFASATPKSCYMCV